MLDSWRWTDPGRRRRVHHAVVAALNPRMIFVARTQHERVDDASGKVSLDGNLSAVVDIERTRQLQIRVGRDQGVQVDHGPTLLPQESAEIDARCKRIAHNLTL